MGTELLQLQFKLDDVIFATHQPKSGNIIIAYFLAFCLPESYYMLLTVLTSSDMAEISSTWVADQVIADSKSTSSSTPSTITAKICSY